MTVGDDGLDNASIVFEESNPVAPTALVTLEDAKDHLNIPAGDTTQDVELEGFISAASAYIQSITGPIIGQTFTESYSGGGPTICLWNPPVLAVTSVVEYVGPTAYSLTQTDMTFDGGAYAFSLDSANSGILRRRYNGNLNGPFAGGQGNVLVTYVAGRNEVSGDIRMAVLQDIAGLFQPSQLGPASSLFPGDDDAASGGKLNPIGMFPRVAEILSAPVMRTPAIG